MLMRVPERVKVMSNGTRNASPVDPISNGTSGCRILDSGSGFGAAVVRNTSIRML
jgi:hypothetical protein